MKNMGIVVSAILGVAVSGCIDMEAWERAEKNGASGGRANPAAASEIQKKIETNVPRWDVYLASDRSGATVVEAIPRDEPAEAIPRDDRERGSVLLDGSTRPERAYENHVRGGRLSLLDMLAIADAIEQKRYRLGSPPSTGVPDSESHGFGSPSRDARAFGSGSQSGAALARQVHDDLLRYVREHVSADQCHGTCEGNYAACSSAGARAFAGGIPCQIGKDSTTGEYTQRYGRSWCTDAFCPAMRSVVEGWGDGT